MGKVVIRKNFILNSQANETLNLIKKHGLEPGEFVWQHSESSTTPDLFVSKLFHKNTKSFFKFDFLKGVHYCVFSPGKEKQTDSEYPGNWQSQITYFNNWLTYLKRELESPNLWETIKQQNLLTSDIDKIKFNDLFTADEILKIETSLKEIKGYILQTYNITESDKSLLESRLNYLVDSSKRLGRKDWIIIFIQFITNIIISLSFSSDAIKELFLFVSKAFAWLSTYTALLK